MSRKDEWEKETGDVVFRIVKIQVKISMVFRKIYIECPKPCPCPISMPDEV
jgi:hypothetical protein